MLLECLAVCPHVKQATFIYDYGRVYPMKNQHAVKFSQKFPSLEKLKLLMNLQNIGFLNLSSPYLPDLREPTFSYLKDLDLSSCTIKDQGFIPLGHLDKLHTLNLEDNGITGCSIPLIDCPNLTDLNLASNALENSGALTAGQCFSKLSKLEKLNLNKNGRIYANGILALVKLTQLKDLKVLGNGMNNEEANILITALPEVLRTGLNPENSRHLTIRVESAPLLTFSDGVNNTVEITR